MGWAVFGMSVYAAAYSAHQRGSDHNMRASGGSCDPAVLEREFLEREAAKKKEEYEKDANAAYLRMIR